MPIAIAVMHNGELSPALPIAEATYEKIGLLMGGVSRGDAAAIYATETAEVVRRIELVKRPQRSALFSMLSPFIAFALTVIRDHKFAVLGLTRQGALTPISSHRSPKSGSCTSWRSRPHPYPDCGGFVRSLPRQHLEISVRKASSLVAYCRLVFLPVLYPDLQGGLSPADALMGMIGGAAFASIPAFSRYASTPTNPHPV